jgi:hypothetical protein
MDGRTGDWLVGTMDGVPGATKVGLVLVLFVLVLLVLVRVHLAIATMISC